MFRFYHRMIYGLGGVSGLLFGLIAVLIGVDVVLRNITGEGLPWVVEFSEYTMYVATVFAAPWVLREGGHVSVDVIKSVVPDHAARLVGMLAAVVGAIVCAIVFYYSTIAAWMAHQRSSLIYKSFTIPEWWVSVFVPFCMALMTIEFVLLARSELAKFSKKNKTRA